MNNRTRMMMVLLAVLLMAGTAQAGEGFKVYGKVHLSLENLDDGGDINYMAVSSNGSRFGIKGLQEMNENFSFIWQFEQKINIAQKGSETLANRNSFVGLKGNWGTALVGIHDTPFKTMGSKVTFFRDEIGDYRMATQGWDRRLQDVVMYVTPEFSGFNVRLLMQVDQTNGTADEGQTVFSGSARYKKDRLYVGAAYETLSKGMAFGEADDGSMVYGNSATGVRFGAKYLFEKIGISALYQSLSDYNQKNFAVDGDGEVVTLNDKSATTFGGEVNWKFIEKFAAKVGYYASDPDTDTDDDEFSLFAIGVDHKYAKDLWFYLQYAMVMNGDASSASLGSKTNGHGQIVNAAGPGENPAGISLGFAKKF